MPVKGGAGAAVSSGASYQARVGAYVIASDICGVDSELAATGTIDRISFETAEEVDDINLVEQDGKTTYIQAKAIINYSIAANGELPFCFVPVRGTAC